MDEPSINSSVTVDVVDVGVGGVVVVRGEMHVQDGVQAKEISGDVTLISIDKIGVTSIVKPVERLDSVLVNYGFGVIEIADD